MGRTVRHTPLLPTPVPEPTLLLDLQSASKAFGAIQALDDVSIQLYAGEAHALVHPRKPESSLRGHRRRIKAGSVVLHLDEQRLV